MTDSLVRESEIFRYEKRGYVGELTLTRPDLLNRIDERAHRELIAIFRELADDDDLRAVVFASTGKVFSAGGDFEFMLDGNSDLKKAQRATEDGFRLLKNFLDISAPVVVALHGDAIGLGASLVLASDVVVAHPKARLSDPHVRIGLVAGDGGCLVWPQAAGMLRARRYLLTGDAVSASDAYSWGLVTDLVDDMAAVLPSALALADRIAGLPPIAVRGTKRALNQVSRARFDEVIGLSLANELTSLRSDDIREAIAAFREKRQPHYEGR